MFYILNEDGNPVLEPDILKHSLWMHRNREVKQTTINDILVSTVFLGIDHSFCGNGPILFETMVFGGEHDGYQERYTTKWKALIGHQYAVNMVEWSLLPWWKKFLRSLSW